MCIYKNVDLCCIVCSWYSDFTNFSRSSSWLNSIELRHLSFVWGVFTVAPWWQEIVVPPPLLCGLIVFMEHVVSRHSLAPPQLPTWRNNFFSQMLHNSLVACRVDHLISVQFRPSHNFHFLNHVTAVFNIFPPFFFFRPFSLLELNQQGENPPPILPPPYLFISSSSSCFSLCLLWNDLNLSVSVSERLPQ